MHSGSVFLPRHIDLVQAGSQGIRVASAGSLHVLPYLDETMLMMCTRVVSLNSVPLRILLEAVLIQNSIEQFFFPPYVGFRPCL